MDGTVSTEETVSMERTDVMEHPEGMPSLSVKTGNLVKMGKMENPARIGTVSTKTVLPIIFTSCHKIFPS